VLQIPAPQEMQPVATLLAPPPAPISGLLSLLPPHGARIPVAAVRARYHEAVAALSERLGTDRWFLGSQCVRSLVPFPAFPLTKPARAGRRRRSTRSRSRTSTHCSMRRTTYA
jgi:hypothetical protein